MFDSIDPKGNLGRVLPVFPGEVVAANAVLFERPVLIERAKLPLARYFEMRAKKKNRSLLIVAR
jgi:hypothetical protein